MKKILIVEDSKKTSIILKEILEKMNYQVFLVHDGISGITTAKREKPDLILLDLLLPKVSGFDVCLNLKKDSLTRHIPIIIISTLYTQENIDKLKVYGAINFLKKPYQLEDLLKEIKKVIGDEK